MTQTHCHPERSLAVSEANSQTQSKDPMFVGGAAGEARNFRVAVRFFDEHNTEYDPSLSREAAKECSPRRKPWGLIEAHYQPQRGERKAADISAHLTRK